MSNNAEGKPLSLFALSIVSYIFVVNIQFISTLNFSGFAYSLCSDFILTAFVVPSLIIDDILFQTLTKHIFLKLRAICQISLSEFQQETIISINNNI